MVKRQLVLVELGEYGADIEVGIRLDFWTLQARLNSERALQEVEGGAHFTNAAIVARHVIEGHGLTELIVFT